MYQGFNYHCFYRVVVPGALVGVLLQILSRSTVRAFSRAVKIEKLKAPLFLDPRGHGSIQMTGALHGFIIPYAPYYTFAILCIMYV